MGTIGMAPEELLVVARALAKSDRNLEIMDSAAILHGYLEIRKLDPNNDRYRQNVENAAASLRQATEAHSGYSRRLRHECVIDCSLCARPRCLKSVKIWDVVGGDQDLPPLNVISVQDLANT